MMEEISKKFEKTDSVTQPDWIRPTVKELDIKDLTLAGFTGTGTDNTMYS